MEHQCCVRPYDDHPPCQLTWQSPCHVPDLPNELISLIPGDELPQDASLAQGGPGKNERKAISLRSILWNDLKMVMYDQRSRIIEWSLIGFSIKWRWVRWMLLDKSKFDFLPCKRFRPTFHRNGMGFIMCCLAGNLYKNLNSWSEKWTIYSLCNKYYNNLHWSMIYYRNIVRFVVWRCRKRGEKINTF